MKLKIFLFLLVVIITNISYARTGAKYLIITPDNFIQAVQPLADWKTKKGVKTMVVPLSVTGNTSSLIKAYILNAYNTWEMPPEYILLAGTSIPTWTIPGTSDKTDDNYADVAGNYRIELSIGRFPCASIDQIRNIVNKTLNYERTPYLIDTLWFRKGMTIVREDYSGYPPTNYPDTYYWENARYCFTQWLRNGYVHIDSLSKNRGHSSTNIVNGITDGRAYVVFRGQSVTNWWPPFATEPNNCNNGYKLPMIISGTCETMSLYETGYLGDRFMNAGSVTTPKGAVGFFASTVTASGTGLAVQRGTVTTGFHRSLFDDKVHSMGDAAKRAKYILDSIQPAGFSQVRYNEWNLFGDPELKLWTGHPKRILAFYDTVIPLTQNHLTVTVQNHSGIPLIDALVCIRMDTTIYSFGHTNIQGQISLPIQSQHIGTADVTITAPNHIPFEGTTRLILANAANLRYDSTAIFDTIVGNNDGKVNPGESVALRVYLKNVGTVTANNVVARLRTNDSYVLISDSIKYYGNIAADSINISQGYYAISISPNCPYNHQLSFNLYIQDNQSNVWISQFSIPIYTGKIIYLTNFIIDSLPGSNNNSRLGPKESAILSLHIQNTGSSLADVRATLVNQNQYLSITDSIGSFGNISTGGTVVNTNDPFAITAAPTLPRNYQITLKVLLTANGGTYLYRDSFEFSIISEMGTTADPTGPDGFGYWSYDNTDTTSGRAPAYNWFEIGPSGPGALISAITNHDAAVTTLRLPFTFRYYGQNYDSISVCSNGFLAMGRTNYRFGNNSGIPDTAGPPAMIAPFWCDLNPDENLSTPGYGDIYQYYDATNHRWIVEFYQVAHYGFQNIRETFQVILYDPLYYSTLTNDGEIVFMYHTVSRPSVPTVGIENQTETSGIQYLYNNTYHENAAPLINSRAVKFTTNPPISQNSPWVVLTREIIRDSIGGNNNGIPEPNETIELITYLKNRGNAQAENVTAVIKCLDGNAVITDSVKSFGNIPVNLEVSNQHNPYIFQIIPDPTDTILDFTIHIQAQYYSTIQYFSIGLQRHPGIEDYIKTNLLPYTLSQNRPNPFTTHTAIRYSLPAAGNVSLNLYDITGKLVKSLVNEYQNAGSYSLEIGNWKLEIPAGVYFYQLVATNRFYKITKKMVVY